MTQFILLYSNLIQFYPILSCFNRKINLMQFEAILSDLNFQKWTTTKQHIFLFDKCMLKYIIYRRLIRNLIFVPYPTIVYILRTSTSTYLLTYLLFLLLQYRHGWFTWYLLLRQPWLFFHENCTCLFCLQQFDAKIYIG